MLRETFQALKLILRDTFELLWQGVQMAAHQNAGGLAGFIAGGVAAAIVCFFLTSWFSRLFNRQIQFTVGHYAWCAFAALVTVILSIALAGVMRLGDVARLRVAQWTVSLGENDPMGRMWEAQHAALVSAGYPQPEYRPFHQGGFLNTPDEKSEEAFASATARVALQVFDEKNPVLHHLIKSVTDAAIQNAVAEMKAYFISPDRDNTGKPLPHNMPKTVMALQPAMEDGFSKSIPGFQRKAIILAIIIVVLAQAIPILLAGLAAYQQISVGGKRPGARPSRPSSTARRPPPRTDRRRR